MTMDRIRNFSIIAHVDHGKSTLADRLIQLCGGLTAREMEEQVLDSMDLERERGITIKAQAVALTYKARNGLEYQINLIDTPGHVDFSYEVSRSLAACDGALLVVDAGQGVEAQSVANCYTAIEQGLTVLPVINKIDLPTADPDRVITQIEDIIGIEAHDAVRISAKTGFGVDELLEQIVERIPPPRGSEEAPLQALIIDSWFDSYAGVVSLVRVVNGVIRKHARIVIHSTQRKYEVEKLGVFTPRSVARDELKAGEVGFIIAAIREINAAPVGDTIVDANVPNVPALPGFNKIQPRVFAGMFPVDSEDYENFREALQKLALNDSALAFEPEVSAALGFGMRCGFLGLLHMEIVQERLEREFNLSLITTAPTVVYEIVKSDGEIIKVENPADLPEPSRMAEIREPIILASIFVPQEYLGRRDWAVHREARCAEAHPVLRPAGVDRVRVAARRGRARFLRSAEVRESRLRIVRLRVRALRSGAAREARHPREQRQARCDGVHRASRRRRAQRPPHRRDIERRDSAAAVRSGDSSRDRLADHRAFDGQGLSQGRHGQALRRRRVAQAQAAREAEGGQEAHEAGRLRGDPARGVSRRVAGR